MNLNEMRRRLAAIPLDDGLLNVSNGNVSNFVSFKKFVNSLFTIPPLAPLARDFVTNPLFKTEGNFSTDPKVAAQFKIRADALYQSTVAFKGALDEMFPAVAPESVIVTIPAAKDLLTVTQILEQLRKALAQLVSEDGLGGKLEVTRWQTGSLVVFIFLGTMAAVSTVARTLRAAAVTYQEIQKGRATAQQVDLLKEHVREAKIKNDIAGTIADAQKRFIKATVEREAKAVELEVFGTSDNERLERIKNSVRILAEMLEKGTTISPALDMPKEERAKFPDVDHLLSAIPPIKQIGDSSEGEHDTAAVA